MEFHSSKEAATSLMRLLLKTHWFPTQIRPEYLVMASYIEHSPAYMSDFKSLFFQEKGYIRSNRTRGVVLIPAHVKRTQIPVFGVWKDRILSSYRMMITERLAIDSSTGIVFVENDDMPPADQPYSFQLM
jgi:hypothetical protein